MRQHHTIVRRSDLVHAIGGAGIVRGDLLLLHSSLSALGYVVGGAPTVLQSFLDVIGPTGTLVVPTHTAENTNPEQWRFPAVPQPWWSIIREESPAFDPERTPSRQMGVIAELFRTWPGVVRSNHPVGSFAALGPLAEELLHDVPLQPEFGEGSSVERIYDRFGKVVLLGVDHDRNTSLHLAEYRADFKKAYVQEGCAMMVDGERRWVEFEMMELETDDFVALGRAFEDETGCDESTTVGDATMRVMPQRDLVDFAVDWMTENRP